MIIFDGRTYLPFHITIPKRYDIEKFILKIWLSIIEFNWWENMCGKWQIILLQFFCCLFTFHQSVRFVWIISWWVPNSNIDHFGPRIRRLLLLFYLAVPSHLFFYSFINCLFRFSVLPYLSPIAPLLSPIDAPSLYLCTRFFPHLSCPVAERLSTLTALLPIGRHRSSALSSHARRPKRFPCASRSYLPPICFPPLKVLDMCPGPCWPHGSPVQGSLPPFACLHQPHVCYPFPPPAGHFISIVMVNTILKDIYIILCDRKKYQVFSLNAMDLIVKE